MTTTYVSERAVSPSNGRTSWVVRDQDWSLHLEATDYLAALDGSGRSTNTQRAYAGRIATFVTWCAARGIDWTQLNMRQGLEYLRWLQETPRMLKSGESRYRTGLTVDAHLITVTEWFRFCARHGHCPSDAAAWLSRTVVRPFRSDGPGQGEGTGSRLVEQRTLKARTVEEPIKVLTDEQVQRLAERLHNGRDRFLFGLLLETGIRIGEALGLRREDMHFLSSSLTLGCAVPGPHVHIRRRADNSNNALAKGKGIRSIPVGTGLVGSYADYTYERERILGALGNDYVFVNLYRGPPGRPMRYATAYDLFSRLATETQIRVHPHAMRHTAATTWLRAGVDRDVARQLLGHASPASMSVYREVSRPELRHAIALGDRSSRP